MNAVSLPTSRKAMVAALIYEAVRSTFAHWEAIPHYDLEREFATYLDEAFDASDRRTFDLATLRFVASLNNGHTAFGDSWLWAQHGAPIGFDARWANESWVVTRSAVRGLESGERIIRIDGETIETFADAKLSFVSGSSMRERRHRLFSRPYLFPDTFEVLTGRGETHRIRRGTALPDRSQKPYGRWTEPNRRFQLTVPSFAAPEFEALAIQCVANLPDDVHLTIDVCGNAGGNTPCDLIATLMPVPYRFWRHATQVYSGLERAEGVPSRMQIVEPAWIEPAARAFGGPMTILIDRGTLSAAEDFVLPFKDNRRARIAGEATGGSSGQPYVCDLGGGMLLWVGSKRQYLPDGSLFEGVGILPDDA